MQGAEANALDPPAQRRGKARAELVPCGGRIGCRAQTFQQGFRKTNPTDLAGMKLGLPQAAPQQSAAGHVRKNGYMDAASNLVPVLPPTYRRGDLITRQKKKDDKKKQQLPSGQYQNILVYDTMTREMPAGHRGLVFSSVVFSV